MIKVNSRLSRLLIGIKGKILSVLRRGTTQLKRTGKMELLGLHLARPWYVRLRLLMWWNYPNTNGARFVSVEFMKMQGTDILLCNGLVLLKTYLLTVIMLAHRPRISMSPYLFHPLAIVAVVTSKPLATSHAELNNNCKLKLQIRPTRLFYKTHCLDDQQSHQAFTLNSFPANLRDCLRQLSIMRNQQ